MDDNAHDVSSYDDVHDDCGVSEGEAIVDIVNQSYLVKFCGIVGLVARISWLVLLYVYVCFLFGSL